VVDLVADLGALGDGRLAENGAHLPLVLAGETVRARIVGDRAELLEVLTPSLERVEPSCPHFGACGGCALQHWKIDRYRAWKLEALSDLLMRAGFDVPVTLGFAAEPGQRRRAALHARPGGRDAARLGYKMRRSWALVPIAACPVADPRLVAAFPALARLAAPLFEHPKSAPTLHATLTETGIDVDITGVEARSGGLSGDARVRVAQAAKAADLARVTLDGEGLYQERQPLVRFGATAVALPAGGFLQAVAAAETEMARLAVEAAAGARRIADLYCGAGAFALRLAEVAPVFAADMSAGAVAALRAAQGSTPGLKGVVAEARDLGRRPVLAVELKGVDVVVFDPPRAGAPEQAREIAASKAGVAVAVSCNPATFVRDAQTLTAGGFRLEAVTAVDQFLWSPHMEVVGVFRR
jgi:23S rRNA (uracil1939-C5)-methyltransferase